MHALIFLLFLTFSIQSQDLTVVATYEEHSLTYPELNAICVLANLLAQRNTITASKKRQAQYMRMCDICYKAFDHVSRLKRHRYGHFPETRPYSCPDCSTKFNDRTHLTYHQKNVHHQNA